MKRLFSFLLALLLAFISVAVPAAPAVFQQVGERIGSVVYDVTHKDEFSPFEQKTGPPTLALSATQHFSPRWVQGNNPRQQLTNLLNADGATVADYQPGNYTGTLNASAWLNSIGAAPSLAQASGAAQPIILPFGGQKYLAVFGVVSNAVSTPATVANTITGNISAVITYAPNAVAPAAQEYLMSQYTTVGQKNWEFGIATTGKPTFVYTTDGSTPVVITSSATLASVGLTNAQQFYLGVTQIVNNGAAGNDVKFYWSIDPTCLTDPTKFTQLGTTQTTAGAITRATSTDLVRAFQGQSGNTATGKGYRAQLYSGNYFAGTGTLVNDFNAADWPETTTNGATAVSSTTGETWTLANTGTKLAQIVGSPQLVFDGAAMYMQAATTLVQPTTVIMVGNQITWTSLHALFDGDGLATGELVQTTSSPTLDISAGTPVAPNAGLVLNTYGIVTATFNGASSALQVNGNAPTTGNAGAGNMGGFTLGANASGLLFGNLQAKEVIILSAVPSAAKLAQIQNLLNRIYHIYAPYASANDWLNEIVPVAANDSTYRLAANGR